MVSVQEIEIDISLAENILERLEQERRTAGRSVTGDDLIPVLQEIQKAYGYLPPTVLTWVSERTGIPTSRMYGIITFYTQFYLEPHGKYTVCCCRGTACHVRGSKKVINAVKSTLGIGEDETTEDMLFSLETVACLGACDLSPVMAIDSTYYGKMTARRAEQILNQIMESEK